MVSKCSKVFFLLILIIVNADEIATNEINERSWPITGPREDVYHQDIEGVIPNDIIDYSYNPNSPYGNYFIWINDEIENTFWN